MIRAVDEEFLLESFPGYREAMESPTSEYSAMHSSIWIERVG
jgi:hypothetical protein